MSLCSSAQQTAAFNPTVELWLCSTPSTPDLPSFFTIQNLQLIKYQPFLFFTLLSCLIARFAGLVFFFSPSNFKPATETLSGKRWHEEKEEKDCLGLCSRASDSPQHPLAHRSWLHTFLNANQMWSNVWQHVFFSLLLLKGRQIYAKNVVLWPSSLSDVKINFRLIPHFPPSAESGWDDTVWFSLIVMLLCCRQSTVERSGTESGNALSAVV